MCICLLWFSLQVVVAVNKDFGAEYTTRTSNLVLRIFLSDNRILLKNCIFVSTFDIFSENCNKCKNPFLKGSLSVS